MNVRGNEVQMANQQLKIFIEEKRKHGEKIAGQRLVNRICYIQRNYKFDAGKFATVIYNALEKLGVDLNRSYYVFVVNPDDSYALGELKLKNKKIIDGRQRIERPINLVGLPIQHDQELEELDDQELEELDDQELEELDDQQRQQIVLFTLLSLVINDLFSGDYETDFSHNFLTATIRVEGEILPYIIKIIRIDDSSFKIRVSQPGRIPYDSDIMSFRHDGVRENISEFIDYVREFTDYVRDQLFF